MSEDRINALMVFCGGLFALIAASAPVIRYIFKKATNPPVREKTISILLILGNLFLMGFGAWCFFNGYMWVAVLIVLMNAITSLWGFLHKGSYPTRGEIFWDAIFPICFFVFIFFLGALSSVEAKL